MGGCQNEIHSLLGQHFPLNSFSSTKWRSCSLSWSLFKHRSYLCLYQASSQIPNDQVPQALNLDSIIRKTPCHCHALKTIPDGFLFMSVPRNPLLTRYQARGSCASGTLVIKVCKQVSPTHTTLPEGVKVYEQSKEVFC